MPRGRLERCRSRRLAEDGSASLVEARRADDPRGSRIGRAYGPALPRQTMVLGAFGMRESAGEKFGDLRHALGEHLDTRFAKIGQAQLHGFADLLGAGGFGDGDERDLGWRTI